MNKYVCAVRSAIFFIAILEILGGCAGKTLVENTRVELARAESLVRAAELTGADELAAAEIAQARNDLELARAYYDGQPQVGNLSGDLKRKKELRQQAMENSRLAQISAEQALISANAEKTRRAEPSQEMINEIKINAKQELASEIRQEVKEEVQVYLEQQIRLEVEQEYKKKATTPVLPPLKFVSVRGDIYKAINNAFGAELAQWELAVDRQYLTVGFTGSATAFKSGSTWVNRRTRRVIEKFFPRFVEVLMKPEFINHVKEIRVEGFASTNYDSADSLEEKNHLNLLLSQERTANMIRFILQQPKLKDNQWLAQHLLPVGFDGRNPVLKKDGKEDEVRSRRVEFRIILEKSQVGK